MTLTMISDLRGPQHAADRGDDGVLASLLLFRFVHESRAHIPASHSPTVQFHYCHNATDRRYGVQQRSTAGTLKA
jgi:hypothetical protein